MNYRILKKSLFVSFLLCCITVGLAKPPSAAGVLPYFYEKSGKAFFLLGQESNNFWADFGGKTEKNEQVLDTAIREFSEETRYVYGKYANQVKELAKNKPTKKFLTASMNYIKKRITGKLTHPKGYYVMYMAEVDFIPAGVFKRAKTVPHYEKRNYAWVSVNKFLNTIQKQSNRREAHFRKKRIRRQIFDLLKSDADTIRKIIYPN